MNSIKNMLSTLRLVWGICKSRVLHEGTITVVDYIEWLFFSSFFIRYILLAIEKNKDFNEIILFIAATAVFFCLCSVYKNYVVNVTRPLTDTYIYKKLYGTLYKKSLNVELRCFENDEFYNKYTMAVDEADKRVNLIVKNFFTIVFGGIATVVAFVIMYTIDSFAMLFLISPLIGNFVFGTILNKLVFKRYEEMIPDVRKIEYINRIVHLSDYAKEMRLTKIFNLLKQKYTRAISSIVRITDGYSKKAVVVYWLHTMLTFTIFQGVFIYGAYRTMISKTMPLSELAVLVSVTVTTTWILIGVTTAIMQNINSSLYMENLFSFLKYKEEIPEDYEGIIPKNEVESVEFRNVSFGYGKEKRMIQNLSFKVVGGTKSAFVGHNGAGKSTIIKLLLRMYDPSDGEILVNGIDIREYNLSAYRQLFAAALQDGKIFSMSIKDNVLMGKVVNREEEIVQEALENSGISVKVSGLSNGMDTVLTKEFDENGAVFSGGQFQKIAVARVFAHAAPVSLFDEPSSALDPIAECELYDSIIEYSTNKTMFLISHRLSSVRNVDMIFMLEQGELIESGSHEDLMSRGGAYAQMYVKQAESYVTDEMVV
ncbi:Lipid A export ATP-binding/permease protein MsbA [compost metagenome]